MTPHTTASDCSPAELAVWDTATLPRMVGHDPIMQARLLALFLRDAPGQISAMEQAAGGGNLALAARVAHTLKTSTRMVGALRMGQLCEDVETAADNGEATLCRSLISGFADSYRSTQACMSL